MNREIAADADADEAPEGWEGAAVDALRSAATRLGVEAEVLAAGCANGELADVIIELRVARFNLPAPDQERVEALLRNIGVLPG
ncbi:MAG TPA: hypothetical protein VFO52_14335 [Longimicrobiales bacterium]|nr:hypothetical protein [Longimicrobiales bacterium]